jgi:N-dimethylarginine dimethylaminohydrolase
MAVLETLGFRVHGVDTSEFRKAGGSVFCLKLMLPKGL